LGGGGVGERDLSVHHLLSTVIQLGVRHPRKKGEREKEREREGASMAKATRYNILCGITVEYTLRQHTAIHSAQRQHACHTLATHCKTLCTKTAHLQHISNTLATHLQHTHNTLATHLQHTCNTFATHFMCAYQTRRGCESESERENVTEHCKG